MKILVAGNSQGAVLHSAWRKNRSLFGSDHEIFFHCVPGGLGPSFEIQDDRLIVPKQTVNPKLPPFAYPPGTEQMALGEFDAVLVSALGLLGGSIGSTYDLMSQGVLHRFRPRESADLPPPVSEGMYENIVDAMLAKQGGIRFLLRLAEFPGLKIVQPMPRLSSRLLDDPDWLLNRLYYDAVGAMNFFEVCRQKSLRQLCNSVGAVLLDHPADALDESGMTRRDFIDHHDGIHPNERYAALVASQVIDASH